MKKFSISIVAGLLTFGIGVVGAMLWTTRNTPRLGHPPAPSGRCVPLATQEYRFLTIGEDGYFPRGLLSRNPELDALMRSNYAKYLARMNEPVLMNSASDKNSASDNNEVYRFTWLRSFHPKVVVRVWSDNGVRMLTVKEIFDDNESRVARMGVYQSRRLKEEEWAEFARLLDQACVWTLRSISEDVIANDGAWWIFEATLPGHYQVVNRQSPEESYRELCLYLLKLSGLPLDESQGEIY